MNKNALSLSFLAVALTGCATIVNDPYIQLTASFSDGSEGECQFNNKRGSWSVHIPGTGMIRRSDDSLIYRCETDDGRKSTGAIVSEVESGKMAASVIFWDLGITDAITDKHRTYQGNVVLPVGKMDNVIGEIPEEKQQDEKKPFK